MAKFVFYGRAAYCPKYPLMSMIRFVGSETYTLIAPDAPAGTIGALATICPRRSFNLETTGCCWPAGQVLKYSNDPGGITVILNEYA